MFAVIHHLVHCYYTTILFYSLHVWGRLLGIKLSLDWRQQSLRSHFTTQQSRFTSCHVMLISRL